MVITRMIHTFMLTMLVISLPYVVAKIGASCQGNSDCDKGSEACSLLGRCQCKTGYKIHIYPSGSADYISECMVCNTTFSSETCMCNPVFYEYQGSCYLKGTDHNHTCYTAEGCRDNLNLVCSTSSGGICVCRTGYYYLKKHYGQCIEKGNHNDTCYTAEGCRDTMNLVCSNSSGGICVCATGSFFHHHGVCREKVPVGHGCYKPDACKDDHARCTERNEPPPVCLCMDGYYAHQGSCILKGDHNDTCYTAEGCRDTMNLVCSNSSGGICACQTGYYYSNRYSQCTEKVPVGHGCYSPDACKDDHARCTERNYTTPVCLCIDGYYAHQGSCILSGSIGANAADSSAHTVWKIVLSHAWGISLSGVGTEGNINDTCYTAEGCRDAMNLVCSNSSGGICLCQTGYCYLKHYSRCTEMPDVPKNLQVLNVTSRAFTIWLEKPNKVFGELLGYVLTIKLANTGRCVKEYIIRCESGCVNPFPNETAVLTTCPLIIQYQSVSREGLVTMERNINTLGPGTVYWVSVAAVSLYGKGFTTDINVTTLHEGDLNVVSHLESNSMTTIIIVSIACGTLIVIALMAAGTVIIIKRRRTSKRKSEADASSAYMDLPCKINEDHYDTLAVTSAY